MRATCVVFDLGGVLIEWDPRHLYRGLLPPGEDVEEFLEEIGFEAWNHGMDAGQGTWSDAVERLARQHPHRRELIAAYPARFTETLGAPIAGSVAILQELHDTGTRLIALTNWSAETFPAARGKMDFLRLFEGVVVSGEERVAKPDPAIFTLVLRRYRLDPATTVFVDDRQTNVDAAAAAGMQALLFTDPPALRRELARSGLLDGAGPGSPRREP